MFNDLKNSKYYQHVTTTIYFHKLHLLPTTYKKKENKSLFNLFLLIIEESLQSIGFTNRKISLFDYNGRKDFILSLYFVLFLKTCFYFTLTLS